MTALYATFVDSDTLVFSRQLTVYAENIDVSNGIENLLVILKQSCIIPVICDIKRYYEELYIDDETPNDVAFTGISATSDVCTRKSSHLLKMYCVFGSYARYNFQCGYCALFENCIACDCMLMVPPGMSPPYYHFGCSHTLLPTLITCGVCKYQYTAEPECPQCTTREANTCIQCMFHIDDVPFDSKCACVYTPEVTSCSLCGTEINDRNYTQRDGNFTYRSTNAVPLCDTCENKYNRCLLCGVCIKLINHEFAKGLILSAGSLAVTVFESSNYSSGLVWSVQSAYINSECEEFIRKNSYINTNACICIYTDKVNPKCRACTSHDVVDKLLYWKSGVRNSVSGKFCGNCVRVEEY